MTETVETYQTLRRIHCSNLPRLLSCPASLQAPELRIEADNEAARLGRAVHEGLAAVVRGDAWDATALALKHGDLDVNSVRALISMGASIWRKYEPALVVLGVEDWMERRIDKAHVLVGTADIRFRTSGDEDATPGIWDWKSGSTAGLHRDQLLGYAWLPLCDRAKIITCWLRDRYVDIEDIEEAELDAFEKRLLSAIAHPETYNPTPANCQFCPRSHECKARLALVRAATHDLLEADAKEITPATLAQLKPKADLVRRVLSAYDVALKDALREAGTLPLGDGRELYLEQRNRSTVYLTAALPVLENHTNGQPLLEWLTPALSISNKKLGDLVAQDAPRREKGKARVTLKEELADAGAVELTAYDVISTRREASHGEESDE